MGVKWRLEVAPMGEQLACDDAQRLAIVQRSMTLYDERLDRDRVVELSGRHKPAVEAATNKTIAWGREIEHYVQNVFGNRETLAEAQPHGPVLAVLPRNDRGDLAPYVLAQCILAGCSYVVRPSSREASAYVTRTYHESLQNAIREVLDTQVAQDTIDELDLLEPKADPDTLSRLAAASPDAGQLVLFGDDETVETIRSGLDSDMAIRNTVRMGTGRSSSVLTPTDSNLDVWCRQIVASASFDKGDDCTSTSVLYVVGDSEFYATVVQMLVNARNERSPGADFARPAAREFAAAQELARTVHPWADLSPDALGIIECPRPTPVVEYPTAVLQVKSLPDETTLLDVMAGDFPTEPSLVTSIYADESMDRLGADLPATLVKYNQPTHDIDLHEPHQGVHLVAALLDN